MKRFYLYPCLLAAALTAACATVPQSRYYTLVGSSDQSATAAAPDFAISVRPVTVPEQVDRPQIVLSGQDGTQVTLLNDSQWAAPLSEEIRDALSQDLSGRLGALEIAARDAPRTLPLWVLDVTVQRFESIYAHRAVLEATWRQSPRQGAGGAETVCRALIAVPVEEEGVPALVAGHQQALAKLGGLMADTLEGRSLKADQHTTLKGCV